jgi:transcriptional regulator with XRE-family HTH domain
MSSSLLPDNVRQVHLVGRKIRELRKERRLTQVELSSRLGIQQSDLCRMEKGEYRVSLDTLFRILAEFKMSIGDFFDVASEEPAGHRADPGPRSVGARWIQDFKALSADAQREVEEFIAFKRLQDQRDTQDSGDRP